MIVHNFQDAQTHRTLVYQLKDIRDEAQRYLNICCRTFNCSRSASRKRTISNLERTINYFQKNKLDLQCWHGGNNYQKVLAIFIFCCCKFQSAITFCCFNIIIIECPTAHVQISPSSLLISFY